MASGISYNWFIDEMIRFLYQKYKYRRTARLFSYGLIPFSILTMEL